MSTNNTWTSVVNELVLNPNLPRSEWHSWDATPWEHPWLTAGNLAASRAYEKELLALLADRLDDAGPHGYEFGFVGNLANNMAMRAGPLRSIGLRIDVHGHPHDGYIMSHPGWLATDLQVNGSSLSIGEVPLPEVPWYYQDPIASEHGKLVSLAANVPSLLWPYVHRDARFLRNTDVLRWPDYLAYRPTLHRLQRYDALFAAQCPYLAYLANKPYLAAQTGGDLWFDASRDDDFGQLQRTSYAKAGAILATNPWAYAHARRFGMSHVLYVPLLIDTDQYSPGDESKFRTEWESAIGGNFYVLMTSRADRMWKGSDIGLEGFIDFARRFNTARLLAIGWGEDASALGRLLEQNGLAGRFLFLPVAGKRRLIEYLRAAHCVLDQFKVGYYGATALEAMSCGKPVVMRIIDRHYDALCPTGSPPVENAARADQVSDRLHRLATDSRYYAVKCTEVRRWITDNHSIKVWGTVYSSLLKACAQGHLPDFRDAPLAAPLKQDEVDYHYEQLKSAPPFPQYVI